VTREEPRESKRGLRKRWLLEYGYRGPALKCGKGENSSGSWKKKAHEGEESTQKNEEEGGKKGSLRAGAEN